MLQNCDGVGKYQMAGTNLKDLLSRVFYSRGFLTWKCRTWRVSFSLLTVVQSHCKIQTLSNFRTYKTVFLQKSMDFAVQNLGCEGAERFLRKMVKVLGCGDRLSGVCIHSLPFLVKTVCALNLFSICAYSDRNTLLNTARCELWSACLGGNILAFVHVHP